MLLGHVCFVLPCIEVSFSRPDYLLVALLVPLKQRHILFIYTWNIVQNNALLHRVCRLSACQSSSSRGTTSFSLPGRL